MDRRRYRLNYHLLSVLILLGMAYAAWLLRRNSLTGDRLLDGGIGLVLGLYICSRPAANAVDLLFFDRHALSQFRSGWEGIGWLALNLLVLLLGWAVITVGATRLVDRIG